jgi:hypothetical protein
MPEGKGAALIRSIKKMAEGGGSATSDDVQLSKGVRGLRFMQRALAAAAGGSSSTEGSSADDPLKWSVAGSKVSGKTQKSTFIWWFDF